MESKKCHISFAAIEPYIETNIVSPKERLALGKNFMEWGDRNIYPEYLLDLYNNVTTLHSIIDGNIDFTVGDEVTIQPLDGHFADGVMNRKGDTITDLVRNLAKDYNLYGGFSLEVIRDAKGRPAEINYLDLRFIRTNKENTVFYYSEDWSKGGRRSVDVYPAFQHNIKWETLDDESRTRHAHSILFVKDVRTQCYPAPVYAAAVKACEIERCVDEYHLNSIDNGFAPSAIINFNNGVPEDEVKKEIEADMNEKFTGHENAGRIMLSWNNDKNCATTVIPIKTDDFGDRYQALSSHSRQQIFSAFRASPLLFGLVSEANTGFSTDEFQQSFKLYNRTQIRPVQRLICDAFDKIYQQKGVMTIVPFTLEGTTETKIS